MPWRERHAWHVLIMLDEETEDTNLVIGSEMLHSESTYIFTVNETDGRPLTRSPDYADLEEGEEGMYPVIESETLRPELKNVFMVSEVERHPLTQNSYRSSHRVTTSDS